MAFKLKSVLLLDNIDKECGKLLEESQINVKTVAKLTKEELIAELKNHDGVIVRSATKLRSDVLDQCGHLKAIGRAGTGVDNIDVKTATDKGIIVMNTPGGNTISAAEQTCSLICSLSRSIPQACSALKLGNWDRKKYMGNELYGKTLAIIGLGRIGREVSSRMKAFGMNIIGYDPLVSNKQAAEWGIKFLQLESIWPEADYITVHTPLIPQTKNLIGEKALTMCKPTVKIVNVARGGIVDEEALLNSLNSGNCGGAALDVFVQEPPTNLDLLQHPNVVCTPHLGANTYEAQKRVAVEIAEQFIEMSQGQSFTGIVNSPELAQLGDGNSHLWVHLAECLGSLCAQLCDDCTQPLSVEIQVNGIEEVQKLTGIIKCAVLSGIFKSYAAKGNSKVNLINSPMVAENNKFKLSLSQNSSDACETSIRIVITSNNNAHSATGTVDGDKIVLNELEGNCFEPRLVIGDHIVFLKSNSFELDSLILPITAFGLASLTVSQDMVWYAIRTKKYAQIDAPICARL